MNRINKFIISGDNPPFDGDILDTGMRVYTQGNRDIARCMAHLCSARL